ncbi:MAG: hypothetical protein KBG28_31505 [Kofleriaceae bacterium]|nr:hypothetical protein [Kofleriaceae bacterium]MBP6840049.1 hypothetical protein [Kofleriaceae bacterium]MBP9208537.1 hypothetical protein [Kofleriaceae bacterium]
MKKLLAALLLSTATLAPSAGCGPNLKSHVKVDQVSLGRVVVYRNGVAYYERRAQVTGGRLTVAVPRDRVDDFLKSLTVIDAVTNKPLPVSFPRRGDDYSGYLEMQLDLPGDKPADVILTYVTESPSWKPSYRVVVGDKGKVMLEGMAIVDNTSGEDWRDVLVGVGSSSAMSFRYDLWNVRTVHRETLADQERFAVAPPTGMSPFTQGGAAAAPTSVAELADDEIRRPLGHPEDVVATRSAAAPMPAPDRDDSRDYEASGSADSADGGGGGGGGGTKKRPRRTRADKVATKGGSYGPGAATGVALGGSAGGRAYDPSPVAPAREPRVALNEQRQSQGDQKLGAIVSSARAGNNIVIEGFADANVAGAEQRALDRANIIRNRLIDQGVAPGQIRVVARAQAGERERVRMLQEAPTQAEGQQAAAGPDGKAGAGELGPVGESHFQSNRPMTVGKGTSAMVSLLRTETTGEVVYLYDAESSRGNDRFAFRAVRLDNPTDSTLEPGPVTVFGNARFIGEGLTEPIPPKAAVVVPFALDRQVVVERNDGDENRISRLVTLQRGILTAEVQHIKRTKLTMTSRLRQPTKVYIRHSVGKGWALITSPKTFERIGDAHLFEIDLGPLETKTIEIAQATPMQRTLDLSSDVALDMMKVYVEAPEPTGELRAQLKELLGIHRDIVDGNDKIVSLRRRLADYRTRMDELHAQLVTLQAVKTGGDLMKHLRAKMKDISDRVQASTIEMVDTEEKVMLARVRFQDQLAELKLGDVTEATTAKR